MYEDSEELQQISYWPSVSDLFMTLFIMALAIPFALFSLFLPTSAKSSKDVVEVARLKVKIDRLNDEVKRLNDKPPIIKISEGGKDGKAEYRFASGSALVSDTFKEGLRDGGFKEVAKEILARNHDNTIAVDTLEVIGHTDGIAVTKRGNLDSLLPSLLAGNSQDLALLSPGSNNDLGLLRALAIKEAWIDFVNTHERAATLKMIDVRCYSAGQTIPEGFDPADPRLHDPTLFKSENIKFRRIEIRLTKLH
jgi:hypothetical protein